MGLCSKSKKGFKFTGPRQERDPCISDLIHGLKGFGQNADLYKKFRLTVELVPGVAKSSGWWYWNSPEAGPVHGLTFQSYGSTSARVQMAANPNLIADDRTAEPQIRRHEIGGHVVLIWKGIGGHPTTVEIDGRKYNVRNVLHARWPSIVRAIKFQEPLNWNGIRCVTIDPETNLVLRDSFNKNPSQMFV